MTPQPDSYGGRGPTLNAVLWTETVVAAMFVFARCYTRLFILHSAGWDDFFLVLTLLLLAAYSACISAGTAYGIGQKRAAIDPADYVQAHMFEIIGQGVCIFNIAISRAAVAFLLLRIVNRGWHKTFIWACIATNSILAVFCTIAVFIQCLPIQAVWNFDVKGNCWLDFAKVGLTTSAYAVCIDFALAIIPCFIVWELNMKKKDKIITIIGLSLGVFAGICGILRTTALTSLTSFDEYIYDTVDMLIYSGTENFVSALCASIPVIRPLWNKVIHGYTTRDGSYPERSYQLSDHPKNENLSGKMNSRGPETRIYASAFNPDNASDETILREGKHNGRTTVVEGNDIFCQTEISVRSTNDMRSSSSDRV